MATQEEGASPTESWLKNPADLDDDKKNLYQAVLSKMREPLVLQRMSMVSNLPTDPVVVSKLGDTFTKFIFNLNKEDMQEQLTGLMLIYPTCLFHVIESSGDMQYSFLKSMQLQSGSVFQETKVLYMTHNIQSRFFHRWCFKTVQPEKPPKKGAEEVIEEEDFDTMFSCVISAVKQLSRHIQDGMSAANQDLNLILSPKVVNKLLKRNEFLSLEQHMHLYNSPINFSVEIDHVDTMAFF